MYISDDFNRATLNPTPGGWSWTAISGTWAANNTVYTTSGAGFIRSGVEMDSGYHACKARAYMPASTALSRVASVAVRVSADGLTYYIARMYAASNGVVINKVVAGVTTQLATVAYTAATNAASLLGLSIDSAGLLVFKINDATVLSVTDTSIPDTNRYCGMHVSHSISEPMSFDDFEAYDLALAPGTAASAASITDTSADLSATDASGGTPSYNYQWQRKTGASTWADISGATTRSYAWTSLLPNATYTVRLKYTDSAGTPAVAYSNEIEFTTTDATYEHSEIASGGTHVLGSLLFGTVVNLSYAIRNDEAESITLGTVTAGANLTITDNPSAETILPGEYAVLGLTLTVPSLVDDYAPEVSIPHDGTGSPYAFSIIYSAADTTAPTASSPTVATTGATTTITLSEPCGPASGTAGFTFGGTSATIASWAISGTTLTLTHTGTIYSTDTPTLSYDAATGMIVDGAGNALASFTGAAVTNGSEQVAPAASGFVPAYFVGCGLGLGFD